MLPDYETLYGILAEGVSLSDIVRAHAGIFYILFLHGTLLSILIALRLNNVHSIRSWPVLIVIGFLLSVAINGCITFAASYLGFGFQQFFCILLFIDIALSLLLLRVLLNRKGCTLIIPVYPQEHVLAALILLFFFIMLRNGGLVDRLADSWYHMVIANRIVWSNSLLSEFHHLSGESYVASFTSYQYRQLWHINLALINLLTDTPLPLVWHSLAAWMTGVSLSGYYIFSLSLSKSRNIAILSVVFFSLLLGGLNSYFRVSPWPGNASYILMYLLFYLLFSTIDSLPKKQSTTVHKSQRLKFFNSISLIRKLNQNAFLLAFLFLTIFTDIFLHMSEVFWFALGVWFYSIVLASLARKDLSETRDSQLAVDKSILTPYFYVFGGAILITVMYKDSALAIPLVYASSIALLAIFRGMFFSRLDSISVPYFRLFYLIIIAVTIYVLVDFSHLLRLLMPAPIAGSIHVPNVSYSSAYYTLYTPNWDHQLRAAILYSGLLGIFGSIYLFIEKKTRATVFLFSTSVLSFISLASPDIFTLLIELSSPSTAYRVHLLIFHPIALSLLSVTLYGNMKNTLRERFL